jgi:hypothetical protein
MSRAWCFASAKIRYEAAANKSLHPTAAALLLLEFSSLTGDRRG